jgi:hypothetical protein
MELAGGAHNYIRTRRPARLLPPAQVWHGAPIFFLAASSVFKVPIWRHLMAWLGGAPATLGHFRRLLKRGSVAVIVGGIAEMYLQVMRPPCCSCPQGPVHPSCGVGCPCLGS